LTIDVGQFVKTAIEKGRQTCSDIRLGICGDPESVNFFHRVGLNCGNCIAGACRGPAGILVGSPINHLPLARLDVRLQMQPTATVGARRDW